MEYRGVLGLAPVHFRLVAAHSADLELVLACGEVDDDRSGGRQPGVGEVDHGLAVDGEVLLPGHGLAHVKKDRIFSILGQLESLLELGVETHLPPVAEGASDIDQPSVGLGLYLLHLHAVGQGIELRQAVVVPQQGVSLAGQDHRDRNLGVDLGQTPRETADIEISVLELAGAVQVLVRRRSEGLRHVIAGHAGDGRLLDAA